ncbi:putative NADP-dependent mannitol dehydrogenase [Diaporthe sp. PMI_573]|nr:putative NADP-dependent mannitol dehydrogenase [Diaporthaceae sp. PMI_573]
MGSTLTDQDGTPYLTRSVQDLFSLKGRVTVITGGARGIGLAWAFACAEAGSDIAILDRLEEPHEHFSKLTTDFDVKVKLYSTDVTNYSLLEQTFAEVVKDFGRIDGLITAAGICPDQPFLDRKPEDVARCFNINSIGTYYTAQLTARQIYISDYCASKGAVVALASQLGCELASRGIRVNSISPGYVPSA